MKPTPQSLIGPFLQCPAAALLARFGGAVALAALFLPGCGDAEETEIFSESTRKLAAGLGKACEADFAPVMGETIVQDPGESPDCDGNYCVTRTGDPGASEGKGTCTCRCAGPTGTGPFCSCGDGFSCQSLIEDFGGPLLGNYHYAGSYCLPK